MVVWLLLFAHAAFAQTLSGTIKDDQGEALFGAAVLVMGKGIGATSNMEGKYVIKNIAAGSYQIRVTYIGHRQQILDVTVGAEGATQGCNPDRRRFGHERCSGNRRV